MKESPYLEGQDQIIGKIKNLPIFKPYDEEKLKGLLRLSKIRQYEPQELIIEEGSKENWICFMISGCVQIEKGGKIISKLFRCGDIFGEMGFLDDEPRSASIRALKDTVCLAVDISNLLNIKDEEQNPLHATIYKMFAQILGQRLRETTKKYLDIKKELDGLRGNL